MLRTALFAAATSVLGLAIVHPSAKRDAVTYTADIKPLVDKKCLSCHVKGGSAPFPLQTYAQVKKRSDLCRRMMLTHTMPPCSANSDYGEFCEGGGPLSDDEGILLQEWIQAGAPEGNTSQPASVPPANDWKLGKPDRVLKPLNHVEIEEEGRPFWRAFVLPLGKDAGRKLRGFELKVDQPQVLRSATLAVARDGLIDTRRGKEGFNTGGSLDFDAKKYIGTWAPGYPAWDLPKNMALTLNGDCLVIQVFYMPRGKAESGDFEVGLHFSKDSKPVEAEWTTIGKEEFIIPAPGNLVIKAKGELPAGARLLGLLPEARFYCSSIRLHAGQQTLFATRRWDPYWAGVYRYLQPVQFKERTELNAEFSYDNDIHMGRNEGRSPDPILPGYREKDELCRLHVLFARR
ncbi:MAG: hypothetical protein JSS66_16615 [Armatimonadetes bacterium]|nr:hypothetical protein [Armatimonadota bacterium]